MSTKIYDGIYLDNMTLTELNDWCLTTRKSLKDIALAQYFRGVIRIFKTLIDDCYRLCNVM